MTSLPNNIANSIKYICENDKQLNGIFQNQQKSKQTAKVLDETTNYFWQSIDRVIDENYIPTKEDIVNVRCRTTELYKNDLKSILQNFISLMLVKNG